MVAPRGKRAIVIGAGIGGLAAAAALARHFDDVTIIERDAIPADVAARPGTPQSNHPHGLLVGGQRALCELFPAIDQDLANAGAVPLRGGIDIREELPGFDPCFPHRDLGWVGYAMSRPLIELVVRRRVSGLPNVDVRCETNVGTAMTLQADLVIDASGRGTPALDFLKATGRPQPEQTSIGVDINYATTTFAVPNGERDWKLVITVPEMPESTRTGYLMPIEGDRWMVLISERHVEPSSPDPKDFLDLVRRLRTPTIFDAIKNAKPLDRIHRFGFPESLWRHYERLVDLPRGLLVLGDAMCRFNPVYGQGMTIAAQEASLLKDLLQERNAAKDSLDGLERAFYIHALPSVAAAWSLSAAPDFIDPRTRGERPADLEDSLRFRAGLLRLAAADSDVHKLYLGVRNLIEPTSKLRDPDLVRRIQAEMADAQ